jgi:hypothetical protein
MEATEEQKASPSVAADTSTPPSSSTPRFPSQDEYKAAVSSALSLLYNQLVKEEDANDVIKKPRDRENYGSKFLKRIAAIDINDLDFQTSRQVLKGLLTIHKYVLLFISSDSFCNMTLGASATGNPVNCHFSYVCAKISLRLEISVELPKETVDLVEQILRFENAQKAITSIADIPQSNSLSDLPNIHIGLWR